MNDNDCSAFLQWALPQLQLRWAGFRKVRKQVCKRLTRRLRLLDLRGGRAYREYLLAHPGEWEVLEGYCRIALSRFYRDRGVFEFLGSTVLPALAQQARQRGGRHIGVWSAGCAGGEEAYSLRLLWERRLASRWPCMLPGVEPEGAAGRVARCGVPACQRGLLPAPSLSHRR